MKKNYLRSCVALACAASMTACGGSDNDVVLYVSVYGVTKDVLILTNNGGPPLRVLPGTSVAQFPELVGADSNYNIEFVAPSNASCVLNNGKGKTGSYSPNNISVVCTAFTYNLGGTITGLKGTGLVLINGSDQATFDKKNDAGDAFPFTMTIPAVPATGTTAAKPETGKVAEDSPYGVLIYQQPTTGTCQIKDGTGVGIMPHGPVTSITITCS